MRLVVSAILFIIWSSVAVAQTSLPFSGAPIPTPISQITCDITTGVAAGAAGPCVTPVATCNGDFLSVTRIVTVTSGTKNVSVTVDTFVSGDVGKFISIGGLADNTIATVTDAQHIVLTNNANASKAGVSAVIQYGTNDSPSFSTFNVWALANQGSNQVKLTVANGANCQFLTTAVSGSSTGTSFARGITSFLASGYGATLSSPYASTFFNLAGLGQFQNNLHSTRLLTASAGATSVFVNPTSGSQPSACATIATCAALFTVGNYALITGFDLQGLWNSPFGYPSNAYYFEYVLVTAINSTTGEITFTSLNTGAGLKYGYKSTWPNFNKGSAFEVDNGGPATLYAIQPSWNTTVEYQGFTIIQNQVPTYAQGKSITYRDMTFTGSLGAIPSQNGSWTAVNVDFSPALIEMDKLVESVTFSGGVVNRIDFQSASIGTFTANGLNITSSLQGTPKRAIITDSTIATFRPGAIGYGRSDEVICTRCVIPVLSPLGLIMPAVSPWTMSGDTITIPNTYSAGLPENQARWAVPGTNFFWRGATEAETLAQVVDVTQDATNTYIQISKTYSGGGFPPVPVAGSGLSVRVHPAPKFTCVSCTGSDEVVAMSNAPAAAPIYSYNSRTYTSAIGTAVQPTWRVWGNPTQINLNVTAAATATQVGSITQFANWPVINSSSALAFWSGTGPVINMQSVGNRQVALSGVTCVSGTCSGDTGVALPDAVQSWFAGLPGAGFQFSTDKSGSCPGVGCSAITITIQTDQGVVNPFAMDDADWAWLIGDNDNKPRRKSVIPVVDNDNVPWRQAM